MQDSPQLCAGEFAIRLLHKSHPDSSDKSFQFPSAVEQPWRTVAQAMILEPVAELFPSKILSRLELPGLEFLLPSLSVSGISGACGFSLLLSSDRINVPQPQGQRTLKFL